MKVFIGCIGGTPNTLRRVSSEPALEGIKTAGLHLAPAVLLRKIRLLFRRGHGAGTAAQHDQRQQEDDR